MNSTHSAAKVTTSASSKVLVQKNDRVLLWDGWRGMAVLLVLCDHFFDIKWLWEGRMGVDTFFVLSGMLMSHILFEKRMSLRDFYIRRLSRVYPVLFVYVLTMCGGAFVYAIEFTWAEVLACLTFLRTYLPAEPGIWGGGLTIAHLWSLNVEEHAYLFLSAMTLFMANRKNIAIALLTVALGTMLLSSYHYSHLSADEFMLFFIRTESAVVFVLLSAGYGMLVRQYNFQLPAWVPLLCLPLAALCYAIALPDWLMFSMSPILLAVAVNHLGQMPALMQKVLSNAVVRQFGLWSYSIYLWQQFFYEYAWAFPGGKLTGLILAILTGVISYYVLEQPIRQWINGRWSSNPVYRSKLAT